MALPKFLLLPKKLSCAKFFSGGLQPPSLPPLPGPYAYAYELK